MFGRIRLGRGLVFTALAILAIAGGGVWMASAQFRSAEAALRQEAPLTSAQVVAVVELAASSSNPGLRGEAYARLMREDAVTVRPVLAEAWGGADEARSEFARSLFCHRWPEEGLPRLARDLRTANSDRKIRWLGIVGDTVGKPSADILLEQLQDPDPAVRNTVCNILRSFDLNPDGKTITGRFHAYSPAFAEVLRGMRAADPVPSVRTHSNCALQVLTDNRLPSDFREKTFYLDAK